MGKLKIRQVRSGLGSPRKVRATLRALGLKHQRTVIKPDNEAIRGMIFHVKHLVETEPVSDSEEKGS